jgi:Cu+-exporting ATPase
MTETTQFKVEDMSCEKCATRVRNAVLAISPAAEVLVDLPMGLVTVKPPAIDTAAMAAAISEAGYPASVAG